MNHLMIQNQEHHKIPNLRTKTSILPKIKNLRQKLKNNKLIKVVQIWNNQTKKKIKIKVNNKRENGNSQSKSQVKQI